jgi:hypothetical protein
VHVFRERQELLVGVEGDADVPTEVERPSHALVEGSLQPQHHRVVAGVDVVQPLSVHRGGVSVVVVERTRRGCGRGGTPVAVENASAVADLVIRFETVVEAALAPLQHAG